MLKSVYLSLGSNVGNREANLRAAIERLRVIGTVTALSAFYETEPVEFTAQPWFLNCAVLLETEKMPRQLLKALLDVEHEMGYAIQSCLDGGVGASFQHHYGTRS